MSNVQFVENKGQWEDNVVFKAKIPGGNLYLEQNELTYLFFNEQDMARLHELHHHAIKNPSEKDLLLNLHAFKIQFLGAETDKIIPSKPTTDFENYFIGNNPSKWASKVKKYAETTYKGIYNNIDFKFYVKDNNLKYDFIVHPGGKTSQIQLSYNGVDGLLVEDGKLKISTSVNQIIEQKPFAYQWIKGKQKEVKCRFKIDSNVVSFDFPKGYDKSIELIIDPTLIFASYSGSTADNWGYTSTFDDDGNLYGGGVAFGVGYPTTVGAFQVNFNGGNGNYSVGCDISITKFSPNGTSLLYSTYIGGLGNESPHSLIVNSNNELIMMGTTASSNYPTSATAYDNTFNGGVSYTASIPNYVAGVDIVISKLSTNGALLLGSTFIGGSSNDGLNLGPQLLYNYADEFRGEVIVDANDNVYVASSTFSNDFPVSAGAFQPALSGGQDGCAFKLSSDLSTLIWSSYIGGTNADAAYSLQFNSLGDVLITGGTESPNFPVTVGSLQTMYQGVADGWITKINNTGSTILASTFVGTPSYDQTYFVQLDTGNNVYVVGQTEGTYPITPASIYNVPNSGQFLHKLNPNLSSTIFSTTFGTGSGNVDIALSAFLVNECNYIFVSGWGGQVNWANAPSSTTNGLPITANALQSTTDGSDYYLMLLEEDATSLMYATFFGGNTSPDHVDGGTSRFDKKGIVYQAVCASCYSGNTTDFPTTPGAWSNSNNSGNCNLGVFKIDLTILTAGADVYATPFHCIGDTVHFQNLSNGGISYYWEFGDGDTSTLFEPYHIYDTLGTYSVMLVSLDSVSCLQRDTDYVDVYIGAPPILNITPINGVCKGDSIQLNASGGSSYIWTPNYNILNDSTDSPTVWPDTTTMYTVITIDSCGMDTSQIVVTVFNKNIGIIPDTMICIGQSVEIIATGGVSYLWSPSATLSNPLIANPIATPLITTIYNVEITDSNNCVWDTLMEVAVDNLMPIALGSVNDTICQGDTVEIYASGGTNYSWSPTNTLTTPNDSVTLAFPSQSTNYVVEVANGCGVDYDTVEVYIHIVNANIVDDTIVCIGASANLWAEGGGTYFWSSSENMSYVTVDSFSVVIYTPTTFSVAVTDLSNCTATLSVFVDTLSNPLLEIGPNIETNWGSIVTLNPTTNGVSFWWSPSIGLSCTDCPNPIVNAKESTTYYLTVQGANGCFSYDTISIFYDGSIYAPNSFSPDGNGVNDIFYVYGKDIVEFELYIFDRWGEKLFYSNDMDFGWDGIYQGTLVKTETYVWKVEYIDVLGDEGTMFGTVTLIR